MGVFLRFQGNNILPMTLSQPARPRVACIGAANIDRKLSAIGPLRMGTSNPARQHESFGGVARNVAENLARLGAQVSLVTAVGDDTAGRALLAHAECTGIDMRAAVLAGESSGTYTAVLDAAGDMALAMADMVLYEQMTPEMVLAAVPGADLVVADLNLPHETVAALIGTVRPLVLVAVSEPKMARLPADLHGLRLLILNLGELSARLGRGISGETEIAAACRDVQAQGARDVVVTAGAEGVWFATDDEVRHLHALPVEVVDVTGAGDAFAAAVCWALVNDDDLEAACREGIDLAAQTLTRMGSVAA